MVSKKRASLQIVCMLLIFVLILSGCTNHKFTGAYTLSISEMTTEGETETKSEEPNEKLKAFLDRVDTFESPNLDYGEPQKIILNSGDTLVNINYPRGTIDALNAICLEWANNIFSMYTDKSKGSGELIVNYNSYVVDNAYASVEFYGEFVGDDYAETTQICATFNADIQTGKLINLGDITSEDERYQMTTFIKENIGIEQSQVDNAILNKWLILEDGIQITLMKGRYLSPENGVKRVIIPSQSFEIFAALNPKVTIEAKPQNQEQTEEQVVTESVSTSVEVSTEQQATEMVTEEITTEPLQKTIALTFDDGPGKHTMRLLDILAQYNIKATFFVLGLQLDGRQEELNRMVAEGHEIATHSWDHRDFTKQSYQEITDEIMKTRAKVYDITGIDALAVRPPYGAYNDNARAAARDCSVYFVNWNIDPLDWKTRNTELVVNEIMTAAKDGAIVLSHDIHPETVDAMAIVIPLLKDQGYTFLTASDLIRSGGRELIPGEVYFSR